LFFGRGGIPRGDPKIQYRRADRRVHGAAGVLCPFESLSLEVGGRLKDRGDPDGRLGPEGRPKWAEDIGTIMETALLQQLYAEVLSTRPPFRG